MKLELVEKIYKLSEIGMSYGAIVEFFEKHEIYFPYSLVKDVCIYKLREKGMTNAQIEQYFLDRGENIGVYAISKRYKRICEEIEKNEENEEKEEDMSKAELEQLKELYRKQIDFLDRSIDEDKKEILSLRKKISDNI